MRFTQTEFYKKLLGRSGERQAEKFLKQNKYKIIEKNYTTKFGEADLIARYKDLIVFIEVKTRTSQAYGMPSDAVDYTKRSRYIKIAEYYLMTHEEYSELCVRFDVIEILNDQINHIQNAFDCN